MKSRVRIPIRLKILITLLILVTGVVSVITFTMANLFHVDKKVYVNDLISIVAVQDHHLADARPRDRQPDLDPGLHRCLSS